jgi:bifunctional DNase/RNase
MAKNDKTNLREAKIFSLAQVVDRCIVVIEEVGGPRLVPIWIGIFEGGAIAAELTGQEPPRPMTHDLMSTMLKSAHVTIDKVIITDLRDNTYFAEIHLRANGVTTVIDSRPSDALALAVRAHCSMFVSETVFEKCPELLKPITDDEVKSFKEDLKNMKPEDFFKDLKKGKGPGTKDAPSD